MARCILLVVSIFVVTSAAQEVQPKLIPSPSQPQRPSIDFPRGITPSPYLGNTVFPAVPPKREALPVVVVPAKAELSDGTLLTGEIHYTMPLNCQATFGEISVPYNNLRAISWADTQGRPATLFLDNGDMLSVTIDTPHIELKAVWGLATIELAHLRTLVLTTDSVEWSHTPSGKRVLVPADSEPTPKP